MLYKFEKSEALFRCVNRLYDFKYAIEAIKGLRAPDKTASLPPEDYLNLNFEGNTIKIFVKNFEFEMEEVVIANKLDFTSSYLRLLRKELEPLVAATKEGSNKVHLINNINTYNEDLLVGYLRKVKDRFKKKVPEELIEEELAEMIKEKGGLEGMKKLYSSDFPDLLNKDQYIEYVSSITEFVISKTKEVILKLEDKKTQPGTPTDEEIIRKILCHLNGENKFKEKLIAEEEYERLVGYTMHLVTAEAIPDNIIPVMPKRVSQKSLIYSFHKIDKEIFQKRVGNKSLFAIFLIKVFPENISNNVTLITSKLSDKDKPKKYPI